MPQCEANNGVSGKHTPYSPVYPLSFREPYWRCTPPTCSFSCATGSERINFSVRNSPIRGSPPLVTAMPKRPPKGSSTGCDHSYPKEGQ